MDFYSEIINQINLGYIHNKIELHKAKIILCKKYGINNIPPDSEIITKLPQELSDEEKDYAISLLRKKATRSLSGVAIIAVMTSPEECPHGLCTPCPGGLKYGTPQSYTGHEPAAMRASLNNFDPFLQTQNRLNQLRAIGHPVDKIDFIIMGGTFTARNPYYQKWFVQRCYDALNDKNSKSLNEAKKLNEKSKNRCIGLTIETRPDWFRIRQVDMALYWGATRVELGVQTIFDNILNFINRGHTVTDSINATRIAKNSGFKICYHLMPNLPLSDFNSDIKTFLTIFEDSRFKPDMVKIYPTLIVKGTKLYDMWKKGDYRPMETKDATKLITEIKTYIPEWVRIQRIQRDIPSQFIEAGVSSSNLRQYIEKELEKNNLECRCIRCREIGHKKLKQKIEVNNEDIGITNIFYKANGSEEIFISLVDKKNDGIIGYLRLRNIINSHRIELQKKPCMIIRELKVVGQELPLGAKSKKGLQHKGYGKELLNEAEKICSEEFEKKRLFVLSGVGVKPYYRKLGFKDEGDYLLKTL